MRHMAPVRINLPLRPSETEMDFPAPLPTWLSAFAGLASET
jgi:hypothetical protein